MVQDFIWCFIFSDVHARQHVALHALLKYHIVVFGVLSNQLLLKLYSSFGKIWVSNVNVIPYNHYFSQVNFVNVNFREWLNELKIGRLKKSILLTNVGLPCI